MFSQEKKAVQIILFPKFIKWMCVAAYFSENYILDENQERTFINFVKMTKLL